MGAERGLSRRALLRATGWSAIGLTVTAGGCRLLPVIPARPDPTLDDALVWVQVTRAGVLRLSSPRQEMGQGAGLGLSQVVAEETGVPPSEIELHTPHTAEAPVARATVGSQSIRDFLTPIAQVSATLRRELEARAASHFGVPEVALGRSADGGFVAPGGRRVSIGELVGARAVVVDADPDVALRSTGPGPKRWVGQPVSSADLRGLVTGAPTFASDVRREGMVHGRVVPPPWYGARLERAETGAARAVPGCLDVVVDRDAGFVGVVAESVLALTHAIAALTLDWAEGTQLDQAALDAAIDVDRHLADGSLEHELVDEDPIEDEPWDVDLRLDVPMAAHAPIEPRVAVADVRATRADLWVGHQDPFYVRDVVARDLGLDADDVVVHPQRIGGAFGGKTLCTVEREAARLSRAVGRPVRVQWSRPDEFRAGFARPPSSHRVRARLKDGRLQDWHHAITTGHVIFTSAALPGWLQTLTSVVPDKGSARGAVTPYAGPRRRIELSDLRIAPPTGPWRGLGAAPNTLAIERAMDASAQAAGVDPIAFRLRHLDESQAGLRACLRAVQPWWRRWQPPTGASDVAVGVAAGVYKGETPAAAVCRLERIAGGLRVTDMAVAQDCGLVVNPDQVRAQIEGNVVWGIGMVLQEDLRIAQGAAVADYFTAYPIPTIADMPRLRIELVGADEGPPRPAAESAIVAVPGAVLNAACRLVGGAVSRIPVVVDPAS